MSNGLVRLAEYIRGNKQMKAEPIGPILAPLAALALALSTKIFQMAREQVRPIGQNGRMGLALLVRSPRMVTM